MTNTTIYLDQLATELKMSQILDRDLHYNEGDTNESIERDNSDGSLRCLLFVQDTDEVVDEDGNVWVCWVDEEEWEKEKRARQNAVRISPFACLQANSTESSNETPIATDTLVAMSSETTTADIASVPSTEFLTSTSTPSLEEYFPLSPVLDLEPDNFHPVASSGEEYPRPLSDVFFFGGYDYNAAVEDHHYDLEDEDEDDSRRLSSHVLHYNTEVEDEDDDEEESDSDDESNDESDDNLDSDTENEDRDDSGGESNLHSESGDNEKSPNPDTAEATPSIPPNNTLAIASNPGPLERFTDTVWDIVGKTLFTIGVCMWRIVPKKLKVKLKARCADYLASGAGSPSTVVEQEVHSEEDKNQNSSENNAGVPHGGPSMDNLNSWGWIHNPNDPYYLSTVEPDYFDY